MAPFNGSAVVEVDAENGSHGGLRKHLLHHNEKQQQLQSDTKIIITVHEQSAPGSEGQSTSESLLQQKEGSSFLHATLNAINVLAGVGILSTPFAVAQGGWLGLAILIVFAVICCYTGLLLRRILDTNLAIRSYPDIGTAAYGTKGRWVVSILLYIDLFLASVEFLILEGDNLAQLFPIYDVSCGPVTLKPRVLFVLMAAILMLPTVWLRNLSSLAYVSAGGAFACLATLIAVFWVGAVDGVGFRMQGSLLNLEGLPIAVGLYAFCYCGHAVFPSIYCSMKDRSKFNRVLIISFIVCTLLYATVATVGYLMFGEAIQSQVTLNLPVQFLASKIAIWITLVNPFAKYALILLPIARALEGILPYQPTEKRYVVYGTVLRTLLVASTVVFALAFPVFGYLMAFIGSFLSVSTAIVVPSFCYLKIFGKSVSTRETVLILTIVVIGGAIGILGTYASLIGIVQSLW